MSQKYKILTAATVIVIALVGYYVYGQYNLSDTQEGLQLSLKHETAANGYLNQANTYESKSDYANAIIMRQKASDEISNALEDDNNVLNHANGVYKDYLNNDILLLQTTSKLINFQIYLDHDEAHTLNPGQETVTPNQLNPYINQLEGNITVYKNNEDKIIAANHDQFKFLNQ